MIIYVDTLFIINALIDYLLLLLAARIAGLRLRRWRFALAAAGGGLFAVAAAVLELAGPAALAAQLLFALAMTAAAYLPSSRYIRVLLIFFAMSAAFAGAIVALGLLGVGVTAAGGGVYADISAGYIVGGALAAYMIMTLVGRFFKTAPHRTLAAKITYGSRTLCFDVLLDTGCTARDTLSNLPVIIASLDVLEPLLPPDITYLLRGGQDASGVLETISHSDIGRAARLRLLPFSSVGNNGGMLLAVRPDRVVLGGRHYPGMLTAIAPDGLEGAVVGIV